MEEDPYRKAGLFGTVSVYRYPYNMGGEFNWHLSTFPYLALCMDKKGRGKAKLREDTRDAHLKYHERTRYDGWVKSGCGVLRGSGGVGDAWVHVGGRGWVQLREDTISRSTPRVAQQQYEVFKPVLLDAA